MKNDSPLEVDEQGATIYYSSESRCDGGCTRRTIIYTQEHIPIGAQSKRSDVLAIFEGERERLVAVSILADVHIQETDHALDKIEHRHAVPHRTQQAVSVRGEDDVPLPVHRPADVAKLLESQACSIQP